MELKESGNERIVGYMKDVVDVKNKRTVGNVGNKVNERTVGNVGNKMDVRAVGDMRNKRAGMISHRARAFAPGHLTAFFMIADSPENPLQRGSLGSGLCLSKGAYSTVSITGQPGTGNSSSSGSSVGSSEIRIVINGRERSAQVSFTALQNVLNEAKSKGWISPDADMNVRVETTLELPEKSGWGMSGAGALSAVFALREALNLPLSSIETASFAHLSELEHSTGLGDVVAQCSGGLTIRKRPGLPPHGFIDTIPVHDLEVVCLTLPEQLSTASVLNDPEKRKNIDAAGRVAVDGISLFPTLDMFFEYSKKFTLETGLANSGLLEAFHTIEGIGRGGMAMLGNSLFVVGETEKLIETLTLFGRVDVCGVDFTGTRVVPYPSS